MWQLVLMAAQMYLGEITKPRPKRVTFDEFFQNNAPDETRPIPYIRGRWKTVPQRAWYGDYLARAVERDSTWTDFVIGGILGGPVFGLGLAAALDTITVNYQYHLGQFFPLTWGPINRVHQVYVSDRPVAVAPVTDNAGGTILLDDPDAFGGNQPPGEGGIYGPCDVIAGTYSQSRNAYMQLMLGNIPALRGVAGLVVRGPSDPSNPDPSHPTYGYFSAGQPNLREWAVELMAWPDVLGSGKARLADDSFNRVSALYELATGSIDFAAAYPVADMDTPAWLEAESTVYDEDLGFSGESNVEGANLRNFFDEMKASIDAEIYEHPRKGLSTRPRT
jgi:hypothetical protein